MALTLSVVGEEREFDDIVSVLYAAFGHPYNSLRQWFIPIHTTTEAGLEGFKGRLLKAWKQNPDLYWLKVTDSDSGKTIGAAEWEIRKTVDQSPGEPKPLNAYWHTEGSEEKRFAEQMLTQFKSFMKARMGRPHIELEQIVVLPEHRNRGAGKMLLDWGTKKSEELGLESCVQSVPFAVPVYENSGYGNLDTLVPDMSTPTPSEKWQGWANDDLTTCLMWRPIGHDYQEGKDKAPWSDA